MKFSIIIPSFNQGVFIERAIRSILEQSHQDFEILVFDGGSTDNTIEVLKKFDSQIKWVSRKDGGQTDAINKGMHAATGDIIAYLNSDDVYFPEALSRMNEHFETKPQSLIAYGNGHHITESDKYIETYDTRPWDFDMLGDICFICQPTAFWRREIVERYGYFDDRLNYAMDYEYWLRIGQNESFSYLEGPPIAGSRLYDDNKTLSQRVKVHKEILAVAKKYSTNPPFRWLQALAHIEAEENKELNRKKDPEGFVLSFVENTVTLADEFKIVLSNQVCRELDQHLKGVGL